jgi:ubiquitin C-terminal hydrolase
LKNGYTGIQTSQQRTLIPQKHVIFQTERKAATEDDQFARNERPVDITKEVQINGSRYRIKGCIFHSGSGQSGHYVYGAYDEQGNPQYVVNDIQTAGHPCKFYEVFRQQNRWLSTTYLYTRV